MHEIIQEITNTPRRNVRIDREEGILYGVKIIGCASRNGREYPNETLREAIGMYENTKVNLDHPAGDPRKPRSYQDRFGVIRNVTLRENDGLFADFRFNPKHAVAEQLLWDAEHAPENVGFSHNVEAIVRREHDRTVVEKIVTVRSVDLVADPATTDGLFESVGRNDETRTDDEIEEKAISEDVDSTSVTEEELVTKYRDLLEEFRELVPHLKTLVERNLFREPIRESKPISREQFSGEKPLDTNAFVKLIKH